MSDGLWRPLGELLRDIREQQGLKQEEAAKGTGLSASKLSRIERGLNRLQLTDLRKLLDRYDIRSRFRMALELHIQRERDPKWQKKFGETVDGGTLLYLSCEQFAETDREYQHLWVPPLLQTEDYASTVAADRHSDDPAMAKRFMALQRSRQTVFEREVPPRLEIVLDENVLRRPRGRPGVMRDQLRHLLRMATEFHVSIQIIPLTQPAHPGQHTAFTVLDFDDERRVLYTSTITRGAVDFDPDSTEPHVTAFQELQASALSEEESRVLIEEAADRHAPD